jgi:hypothetical protein
MRAIYVVVLGIVVSVATNVVFESHGAKADAPRPGPPPDGLWIGQRWITDGPQSNFASPVYGLQRSTPLEPTVAHRGRRVGRGNARCHDLKSPEPSGVSC